MIEFATLLLAAAALIMAIAAFRKATAPSQDAAPSRDPVRQDWSGLAASLDSLPGRIADETSASPLREAVEGVRESIAKQSQSLDAQVLRVGQAMTQSSTALEATLERVFVGLSSSLEAIRQASEVRVQPEAAIDPRPLLTSIESALRQLAERTEAQSEKQGQLLATGLRQLELSQQPVVDAIGQLAVGVDTLPASLGGHFARLENGLSAMGSSLSSLSTPHQADSGASEQVVVALAEQNQILVQVAASAAVSAASSQQAVAALELQGQALDKLATAVTAQDSSQIVAALLAQQARLDQIATSVASSASGSELVVAALELQGQALDKVASAVTAQDSTQVVAALQAQQARLDQIAGSVATSASGSELVVAALELQGQALDKVASAVTAQDSTQVVAALQAQQTRLDQIATSVASSADGSELVIAALELQGQALEQVAAAVLSQDGSMVAALQAHQVSLDHIAGSVAATAGSAELVVAALEIQSAASEALNQSLRGVVGGAQGSATGSSSVGIETLSQELQAALAALPRQIAEASAQVARPMPELEELAIAVRESAHLRGDASRSIADAVARVSHDLSESADLTISARAESAAALVTALDRLEAFAGQIETRMGPLSEALKGHGEAVAPMAVGLLQAQDRLEEAAASLRANQAEFAASVGIFTQAASELSGGLSLFAREGDRQGSEDPRAAQKALLESLDRMLSGFADALKALLTESDLRTREVLAEIAARLPGSDA